MKINVLALCLLFSASVAFGQTNGSLLNSQPSMIEFSSHESSASPHSMGAEKNLLDSPGNTWAQGERPLWEVAPVSHPTPLGDSARVLKKEHAAAKKADLIWNNN
jgi:hypothetical protein